MKNMSLFFECFFFSIKLSSRCSSKNVIKLRFQSTKQQQKSEAVICVYWKHKQSKLTVQNEMKIKRRLFVCDGLCNCMRASVCVHVCCVLKKCIHCHTSLHTCFVCYKWGFYAVHTVLSTYIAAAAARHSNIHIQRVYRQKPIACLLAARCCCCCCRCCSIHFIHGVFDGVYVYCVYTNTRTANTSYYIQLTA